MTIYELCEKYELDISEFGDISEISDGHHTYNALYHQRLILFAALCNTYDKEAWKSRRHSDGELCFGGDWFIVGIDTPDGQYTYHYKDEYWDLFHIKEFETGREWDGHTDKDVTRVLSLIQKPKCRGKEGETCCGDFDKVHDSCTTRLNIARAGMGLDPVE